MATKMATIHGDPTPCPVCADIGGFHDEDVHAARPVAYGKLLPPPDSEPCRACGLPLDGPGADGCRYPNHGQAAA
jgi:hypothetical protein